MIMHTNNSECTKFGEYIRCNASKPTLSPTDNATSTINSVSQKLSASGRVKRQLQRLDTEI